jgi:DMSO/TMAO reductase YedYZ molybdopterin-dependent catalytic subunit
MSILTRLRVPVFQAEGRPRIDPEKWRLRVDGLIEQPVELSLAQVKGLRFSRVDARLVSVSGWSVRANWEGVLLTDFLEGLRLRPQATHATFTSIGRYSSTISLDDLRHPRVLLCYAVEGEPLEVDYGAPLRLIVPQLWGYKSVKNLARIELADRMHGGFWEDRGYPREAMIEPGMTLDINTRQRRAIRGGEVTEF